MPIARFLAFTYSTLTANLKDEGLREVNNLLFRDPRLQTTLIPGVPIPAWMDMADIPTESIIEVDTDSGEEIPVPAEDPRLAEYLASAPNPPPPSPSP